jgi:GR25 family glycosyltransferase involved in LPS biosynthesis
MFLKTFLLICALGVSSLFSNVENHLKKITDKGTAHHIRNIDFIYTISLKERPEKFESCIRQLKPYGIYPYRFLAINGWKLPLKVINDIGVKYKVGMSTDLMGTYFTIDDMKPGIHEIMNVPGRTYFCHCLSRGAIGCALSHLSVLQDALNSGYKTIWVMEDDITVVQNPHKISDCIDALDALVGKKGWDILFTDQDTINNTTGKYVPCFGYARRPNFTPSDPDRFVRRIDISKDFRKVGARYGTYSMIIRRSGIKKILSFIKKHDIFLPIDMDFIFAKDIKLFTVIDDIVSTQRYAQSDNGKPGFLENGKK